MLEMINVTKTYPGGSVALQDINVRIEQGEFVFVVGPSGAGKSTFFKMLFREVLPSSGKVIVVPRGSAFKRQGNCQRA